MARYSISDHAEKYGEEDSGKMLMNADEIIPWILLLPRNVIIV